ncbi:carboxysome peptide B [Cyanobium sp. ATX 6A2]|jgi:carboxysome peptide B|uniref:carboxysome peptide B n=1 Tax=Cyanobium sp. ATX 6A2 TaxID=2823700 RepID=UPI0020CDFB6E|nr:carboxysome peptide B [Cyanobium sp. ATX 6A2]MCP9887784.1 carboxysome peptide B [Cyanobium sp. ATX 6A2]
MEIMQVITSLVCTERVGGLNHCNLRVLRNNKGKMSVAVDPVGAAPGNWVFTASGSAARFACPDPAVLTDLTIGGIIDFWEPDG